jgi:cystathionine gamma-lyase
MDYTKKNFETKAIHVGQPPDGTSGAIMVPITLATTYVQESPGVHKGYDYSRADNPTREAYERCLASLENSKFGYAFASGCAATTTIIMMLKAGDHVICSDDVYGGTFRLFDKVIQDKGIKFDYVDLTKIDDVKSKIKSNTKLIWIETPTNPLMKVVDIKKITALAKTKKIWTVVDNTFMSPYFQNPIDLGATMAYHSTTKYIGGHSDVIGGFVATNDKDVAEKLKFLQKSIGAVPSPFDCYLAMRSLKTLAVRMEAHAKNAMAVAQFLEKHPKVEKVIYPGLKSHPQHDIAKKQMSGFGGMMSFYIKGGLKEARTFLENVSIFALAESLGGVESLIEHPGIMTHASVPAKNRKALGIDDTLIRLSVGIENQQDLIEDLKTAFSKVK